MRTRLPAVAGRFYPADPAKLDDAVTRLVNSAPVANHALNPPKALILPHAGYIYSGATAAAGYATLRPFAAQIKRIILLGPCHYIGVHALALPEADAMLTPLGSVPIWAVGAAQAAAFPQVIADAAVHAEEHSLEVHLPFLQHVLPDF